MNNLTNYHSHTSFCDGKAPMEAFIAEAVRQGFTSYGVSSHAPLPFRTRWTIDDREQTGLYLQEFARLKRLYGDRIELYVGLEIDYMDEDQQPANDYFQSLPLDYRIGSVHLLHSTQGEIVDIDQAGSFPRACTPAFGRRPKAGRAGLFRQVDADDRAGRIRFHRPCG